MSTLLRNFGIPHGRSCNSGQGTVTDQFLAGLALRARDPGANAHYPLHVMVGCGDASRKELPLGNSHIGAGVWWGEQPADGPLPVCAATGVTGERCDDFFYGCVWTFGSDLSLAVHCILSELSACSVWSRLVNFLLIDFNVLRKQINVS